jgi:uncharacterized protein YyaL (SSP411 family)
MNRLSKEKSAYLRHAASQTINWYPWNEDAFKKAKKEDMPIFLSTGALWCHWCHVMAKECFENEEIAELLNKHFVSIKLDRDERPDIDRRYQRAVAAMGSGGGWPLSVFLTPDKKPFFGGTYFPPEDRSGRPGFKKVLVEVSLFYRSKKEEIAEYTERLIHHLTPPPLSESGIEQSYVDSAVDDITAEYDPQNGGFGSSPKFPMPGALELLINRYFFKNDQTLAIVIKKTLTAMGKGGFHDQLQGGFHRYSTDEAWIVPHFEKMADDNAWLLRNYSSAYRVFGDEYFREVVEGITVFLREVLSDPDGGFFASQDADVTPDDEGGYFTWTDSDFKTVLEPDEYRVLSMHLLNKRGSMHHDESKSVLFVAMDRDEIAEQLSMDKTAVAAIISRAKEKVLSERQKRQAPVIDHTLYTSLNGMLISSCLHAFRVIGDTWLRDFPLKSLDTIVGKRFIKGVLYHTENIRAALDDYVFLVDALLAAYEIIGTSSYLRKADELMEVCIKNLWDDREGGFFDTDDAVLGIRLKGIEDIPHPSANSVAIMAMLKLYDMTGKAAYYENAEKAVKVFVSQAKDMGIHSGYYFCSLDAYFNMLKLTLDTSIDSELASAARSSFRPYTSLVYGKDKGLITPCMNGVCDEPIDSPDSLRRYLALQRKGGETE